MRFRKKKRERTVKYKTDMLANRFLFETQRLFFSSFFVHAYWFYSIRWCIGELCAARQAHLCDLWLVMMCKTGATSVTTRQILLLMSIVKSHVRCWISLSLWSLVNFAALWFSCMVHGRFDDISYQFTSHPLGSSKKSPAVATFPAFIFSIGLWPIWSKSLFAHPLG